MKPVVVSDILAIGEFPTPDQIAILAKAGFRSLINNQPDGEVDRFPADAALAATAAKAGLKHAYAPLSSRTPEWEELAGYGEALKAMPAPVYAFCYSGARSAAGAALLMAASQPVEDILSRFEGTGYDLAGLRPWLEDARAIATGAKPAAQTAAPEAGIVAAPSAAPAASAPIQVEAAASQTGEIRVKPPESQGGGALEVTPVPVERAVVRIEQLLPRVAGGSGFAM